MADRKDARPLEEQVAAWEDAKYRFHGNFLCMIKTPAGVLLGTLDLNKQTVYVPTGGTSQREVTNKMAAYNNGVIPHDLDALNIEINQRFGSRYEGVFWSSVSGYETDDFTNWTDKITIAINTPERAYHITTADAIKCSDKFSEIMGEGWGIEPMTQEQIKQLQAH